MRRNKNPSAVALRRLGGREKNRKLAKDQQKEIGQVLAEARRAKKKV
jgi:hypothetical protein